MTQLLGTFAVSVGTCDAGVDELQQDESRATNPSGMTVRLLGSPGLASDLVALVLGGQEMVVDDLSSHGAKNLPDLVILVDPAPEQWDSALSLGLPLILISGSALSLKGVVEAILRGADAVVHADSHPYLLLDAVRVVAGGGTLLDPHQARALALAIRAGHSDHEPPRITERERQILFSITRGHVVKQTAITLGISSKTVENLQGRLFCKLGVHNRAEAVTRAFELGLLDRSDIDRGASRMSTPPAS